ncbi:hypothetical protein [Parvicella tangerina]|uniref:Uncharacterized protein n=1 Tax=Parvicella tangerina TaxID=2829795 RepID=A0A916NIP5_9FLAO|nr:hypothetical protein [Parvicella tangerina]CAG5084498.1 hypothetical protein CRYO30217_02480 [Parvicella tangerina]
MKKLSVIISIIILGASLNSCRLFQGGGGGGHCPAYGSSIEKEDLYDQDINNESELRASISESM